MMWGGGPEAWKWKKTLLICSCSGTVAELTVLDGVAYELGACLEIELMEDPVEVGLDGGLADIELMGNLLISQALADEGYYFLLSR